MDSSHAYIYSYTFVCAIIRSVRNVAYLYTYMYSHTIHNVASSTLRLSELCFRNTRNLPPPIYACVSLCTYICVFQPSIIIFSQAHTLVRAHIFRGTATLSLSKQPLFTQKQPASSASFVYMRVQNSSLWQ